MIEIPSNGHGIDTAGKRSPGGQFREYYLDRIQVGGGSTDQYRTFYSCLYRSLLFPRKFYEFDAAGKPVHYSPYNGQVCDGYLYTDTGFWDTFRALFPLLNLVYPSVNQEIQEGLENIAAENDFLSHSTLTEGATLHFSMCNPIHHHKPENHRPR